MKIWLSWSSGKDSAWSLHTLQNQGEHEVAGLLTTVNAKRDRVAMHGVRRTLLERQAAQAGLPLVVVELPEPCDDPTYRALMNEACQRAIAEGVEGIAFGDLYLESVRSYREEQLAPTGLRPIFPLWGLDTRELISDVLDAGISAVLTCVDSNQLDPSFSGRTLDHELLADLPSGVDPCGENGEFHTFVSDGPMFGEPIPVVTGERVDRSGFIFTDVLPA